MPYISATTGLFSPSQAKAILAAAKSLPKHGVLMHKEGEVYLKVDDNYIHKLAPLFQSRGFEIMPYFDNPNSLGAHISVIYPHEKFRIEDMIEIGKDFTFNLQKVKTVRNKLNEYIILQVTSPQLEGLRHKYKLSPQPCDLELQIPLTKFFVTGFYITIAQKTFLQ